LTKSQTEIPHVGIFYFVGGKLWLDTTPLAEAEDYGDGKTHERSHVEYWERMVRAGSVPDDEYEEHPRGRVNFNKKTGRFLLLADKCILQRPQLIDQVMSEMHLPPKQTDTSTDPHYRCFRCLGRLDDEDEDD
jgi:hypothetical protein